MTDLEELLSLIGAEKWLNLKTQKQLQAAQEQIGALTTENQALRQRIADLTTPEKAPDSGDVSPDQRS